MNELAEYVYGGEDLDSFFIDDEESPIIGSKQRSRSVPKKAKSKKLPKYKSNKRQDNLKTETNNTEKSKIDGVFKDDEPLVELSDDEPLVELADDEPLVELADDEPLVESEDKLDKSKDNNFTSENKYNTPKSNNKTKEHSSPKSPIQQYKITQKQNNNPLSNYLKNIN
jgi:hypothetical protein